MAAVPIVDRAHNIQEDEDPTDEQIEELLARASARLKENPTSKEVAKGNGTQMYNFPKLETGNLPKPYISNNTEVATVDAPRLLEQKQRNQANGIRKVEDPVHAKKAALAVRLIPFISHKISCKDEKQSQFSRAESRRRFG